MRVFVLEYSETAQIFGGATDTGIANVTIFMDVSCPMGLARDQTGMDMDGGGGIDGEANAGNEGLYPFGRWH